MGAIETTTRNDGLDNPLSPNSGIGCSWNDVERRCNESSAVEDYRREDGGLGILWTDGTLDIYRNPQAALIAIREMETA